MDNIERIKALEARPLATPTPTVVAAPVTSSVDGDKITALGMNGQSKKLSDIAQELNWTKNDKMSNKIILDKDLEIIAVLGYRISEKIRIDSDTKQILILNLHETN